MAEVAGMQSLAELRQQLLGYQEQLKEIQAQLRVDPSNAELIGARDGLQELVQLTQELIDADVAAHPEVAEAVAAVAAEGTKIVTAGGALAISQPLPEGTEYTTTNPGVSSTLPPSVQKQMRLRRVEQALAAEDGANPAWVIGEKIDAIYSQDGQWYPAKVVGATPTAFVVLFEGYDDYLELIKPGGVRPRKELETGYVPLAPPKRRTVVKDEKALQEALKTKEIPEKYQIKDGDDEETKEKKRKAIRAIKKEQRFVEMDMAAKEKADAWKQFQNTKGAKRAKGFITGVKRSSIFQTNDTGKVGVTGSGKGVTENRKRAKHGFDTIAQDE